MSARNENNKDQIILKTSKSFKQNCFPKGAIERKNCYSLIVGGRTTQVKVQDGNWNVKIVSDGMCLCPDRPRRKDLLSSFFAFTRISRDHVLTLVSSPDYCAFMFRLSCVPQTFGR